MGLQMTDEIPLWGDEPAPGSEGLVLVERIEGLARRVVTAIVRSTLTVYLPTGRRTGASALVIPGGGYTSIVFDKEGVEVARWLAGVGVAAFVLKHRLPGEGHADGARVPLQDAQRALRMIRGRAAESRLDPDKTGVVGLSSGAHLAATLGAAHDQPVYTARDGFDALSARPAFMALAYGPYSGNARDSLIDPAQAPLSPPEKQALYDAFPVDRLVSGDTPPAFLVSADDDHRVNPVNSIRLYLALRAAGIPSELHIFKNGGHGFAIFEAQGKAVATWTRLCEMWLASLGMM